MELTQEQAKLCLEGMNALMQRGMDLNAGDTVLKMARQLNAFINAVPPEPENGSNGATGRRATGASKSRV